MSAAFQTLRDADLALSEVNPKPFAISVGGLEAVVIGALDGLSAGDWWVPGLRERVGGVLRGASLSRLTNAHSGAKPYKIAPTSGAPALRALTAVGLALSSPKGHTLVHLGLGSASCGDLYEAFNLASLRDAPVIFLVALHPLNGDAPLGPQLHAPLKQIALGFGLNVLQVDGSDATAIATAVQEAKTHAGPTVLIASLPPVSENHS